MHNVYLKIGIYFKKVRKFSFKISFANQYLKERRFQINRVDFKSKYIISEKTLDRRLI